MSSWGNVINLTVHTRNSRGTGGTRKWTLVTFVFMARTSLKIVPKAGPSLPKANKETDMGSEAVAGSFSTSQKLSLGLWSAPENMGGQLQQSHLRAPF